MKHFKRFLIMFLCVLPYVAGANVATTAGSNLTAWNGNSGSTNNNNWNTLINSRVQPGGTAKADFGNCNSLILRCAQPKCTACTTMELAKPVVSGCVNSNKDCKKHGDDLIEFIAAQIVANAAEKAQAQELAIKQAEAQAAAAQSSQKIEEMQQQMAQMQRDMKSQNDQQMEKMQAALDEQKALNAKAAEQAAAAAKQEVAASTSPGVTVAQQIAIDKGIGDDVLVRQQIGGEVLTAVEAAEKRLVELESTMKDIFSYAHCDSRGGNCAGPKRVKIFKDKAMKFFDPYEAIAEEMEEALELALAVGIDVTDIIMMLNGSCSNWGRYLCSPSETVVCETDENGKPVSGCKIKDRVNTTTVYAHHIQQYNEDNCLGNRSISDGLVRGGFECREGQAVPPQDDVRCTMIGPLYDDDGDGENSIEYAWVQEQYLTDKPIRVGCATSALDSISLFAGRKNKKARTLDLDTLERIIEQDSYDIGNSAYGDEDVNKARKLQYCGLTVEGQRKLSKAITTKKFSHKDVCVRSENLLKVARNANWVAEVESKVGGYMDHIPEAYDENSCKTLGNDHAYWNGSSCMVRNVEKNAACNEQEDSCSSSKTDKCGKFNYWNGVNVVTVTTDEDKCQMYRHRWLSATEAKSESYSNEDPCCACTENDYCFVENKCEKTSG